MNIAIDCFEVYDTSHTHNRHVAYVTTEKLAQDMVDINPYLGYGVFKKEFHLFASMEECEASVAEEKIKAAKAKLTEEELQLLGLE